MTSPSAHEQHVGEAVGDLLDVVGDEDRRRGGRVRGDVAEPADQVVAGGEVQPGGRLVEQQQARVGHQGAGQLDPLALTRRQRAELGARPSTPTPSRSSSAERPAWSSAVYVCHHGSSAP